MVNSFIVFVFEYLIYVTDILCSVNIFGSLNIQISCSTTRCLYLLPQYVVECVANMKYDFIKIISLNL